MLRRVAEWIIERFFAQQLDRALIRDPQAFYRYLRRAGYPLAGDTLFVYDAPQDRQRFLAAIFWSLRQCLKERERNVGA
jgi:hypothetical protein